MQAGWASSTKKVMTASVPFTQVTESEWYHVMEPFIRNVGTSQFFYFLPSEGADDGTFKQLKRMYCRFDPETPEIQLDRSYFGQTTWTIAQVR